jgi:hypothetical protein
MHGFHIIAIRNFTQVYIQKSVSSIVEGVYGFKRGAIIRAVYDISPKILLFPTDIPHP